MWNEMSMCTDGLHFMVTDFIGLVHTDMSQLKGCWPFSIPVLWSVCEKLYCDSHRFMIDC